MRCLLEAVDGNFFDDHLIMFVFSGQESVVGRSIIRERQNIERGFGSSMPISTRSAPLATALDALTVEGAPELTEHLPDSALKCYACGHRCLIREGKRGICKVRFNENGRLLVPANYVAALACDPTEKKPFFHVLPGSDTLTFGMLGCDLHCAYCQNWLTSQALRDDTAGTSPQPVTPERLVAMSKAYGASLVGTSYNEPLITAEWAVDVFQQARAEGCRTAFISNGMRTQVLDYLRPWTDCYKIDLKVVETTKTTAACGRWSVLSSNGADGPRFEVRGGDVTWVSRLQRFRRANSKPRQISCISVTDIPWHVTAFIRITI